MVVTLTNRLTSLCWIHTAVIMELRCGSLFFTSKFDSGNLARVEKVTRGDDDCPSSKNCFEVTLLTDKLIQFCHDSKF